MNILPKNWTPYGRTLYLEEHDTLIVSDIHFGKCISKNRDILEKYNEKYMRLNEIIENLNPNTLILNGDVFYCHSDYFDNQLKEDEYVLNILNKLKNKVNKLILLEGNHEFVLGRDEFNLFNFKSYHIIDDILIHHGHKIKKSKEGINHHIIGHIHPSIDGKGVFHYSEEGYKNKSVTILPAFCRFVDNVNINNYNGICPLFENGTKSCNYESLKL